MNIRRAAVVVSILIAPSLILWGLTAARTPTQGLESSRTAESAGPADWEGLDTGVDLGDGDLTDDVEFDDAAIAADEFPDELADGVGETDGWEVWDQLGSSGFADEDPLDYSDSGLSYGIVDEFDDAPSLESGPAPGPDAPAQLPAASPAPTHSPPAPRPRPSTPAPSPSPSPPPAAPAPIQSPAPVGPPRVRPVVLPTSCGGLHVATPDRDGWRNLTWATQGGQQMNILGLGWNPSPSIGVLTRTDAFWVSVSCVSPVSLERSELYVVTACGVLRVVNGSSAGTRRVAWVADRQVGSTMNAGDAGWTGAGSSDVHTGGSQFGLAVKCSTTQHLMAW